MGHLLQGSYLSLRAQQGGWLFYPRIPVRFRWCMCVVLLLVAPLSRAGAQCAPSDRNNYTCPPQGGHSSPGGTLVTGEPNQTFVFLPPMGSGCDRLGKSSTPGESEARAAILDKQGPQLGALFSMSAFAVMGFSRGNWPIVVDYLLEEDSLLLVVISPEGQRPLVYRLDGKKGHWQTRIQLPSSVGNQLRVSEYLVQTLDNSVGLVSPSHVHIHGIAAGPKAVGSIGIDQVDFGPANIQLAQHQHAQYSFHSMFDFKNTEVTFVRLAKSSNGEIIAASVGSKSMGSIAQNARKDGDWDGSVKTDKKVVNSYPPEMQRWLEAPNGQHALQVRAWFGVKDGGDWVTALSESIVSVE
jgi:hypothetical protein